MKGHIILWVSKTVREAAWAPILVFGFHVIASRVFHAYLLFPALDIPVHFFGGVVIAFFFHRATINAFGLGLIEPQHPITHPVLVFSLVGTTTILWEFYEFISDRFFGTHAQLGLPDTLFDMLLGLLGGISFLMLSNIFAQQDAPADASHPQRGSRH